jgi:hypothetical protein
LRARGRCDEYLLQRRDIVAKLACVADIERVALWPFNRRGDVHTADSGLDDVLDVADGQAVTGGLGAVDVEVKV